ncbi:MAG: PLP-dependent aminotransferase family protein [Thermoplasmata archaeon]
MDRFEHLYSDMAKRVKPSDVREILKLMQDPEIISFAGGMPNPDTFPVAAIKEIAIRVLEDSPVTTLQYGTTEGYNPLRETMAEYMSSQRVDCSIDNVLIMSGATQAIALTAELFLDNGATVLTESPTFLAGLICFRNYGARIIGLGMDDDGVRADLLEEKLRALAKQEMCPTLFYTIPNFQNPTGVTLSESRRRRIVDLANEFDFIVLEDDPYCHLRFEGEHIRPIKSFDDSGRVIYTSSFSKILSPGMRLGWTVADAELTRKLALLKQTSDVSTNVFSQRIANEYVKGKYFERQLPIIKEIYGRKQKIMLSALERYFPESARWTRPKGGMFLWVELQRNIDTKAMFPKAIERKVAYVQGSCFFPDDSGKNTMRLNFTHPADEKIDEGIRRLGSLIDAEMKASSA